ncbi:PIN domain-like protein [Periconia macrospinosa]|uniref:PIN domain-like protein n=1 Tax=Periconia macrospinosa TaxID=97972 RepID=A0A2V1DWF6_9PLEO|nr:PIN domain-like protein [Periconia macrospinosa]
MGVTGLWTVLQPCARPIRIETLNKKRLAVDASIWIYQFLKAVRDKEGNALRNSHIVGFFRRICKLLFIGIKPVFVFDGGAPALKRQTINNRKSRREGRREDALKTAGKLLAIQMQRAAEEEEKKRKEDVRHPREEPEETIPEDIVYADEILQTPRERMENRKFKKKDQYHLPELGVSLAEMGQPNDPRIMSLEELEEYARQFDTGEDINVYDFSKIDFDSPFFISLPASDRYNILNAARLRSRLRMGYSKDQLDNMFPNRMDFSRFQIERVRERNELTQRLMNLNGMSDDTTFSSNRIAGDKGREYVLVKNEGVEGGWALGVVTNKDEGKAHKPIDVDYVPPEEPDDEEWEDEDDFEDVPIEGLNRLPKPKPGLSAKDKEGRDFISREVAMRRQRVSNSNVKRSFKPKSPKPASASTHDPDSLFLADDNDEGEWEQVPTDGHDDLFYDQGDDQDEFEEQQLQKAIALSMQQGGEETAEESEEDIVREVFQQERAKEVNPFAKTKGSGMAIARLANQRSSKAAPSAPFNASDSDDDMDLQAALAESRKSKRSTVARRSPPKSSIPIPTSSTTKSTNAPGFDGPLPFERLNLGNSLLGKKKMQKLEEANAGGFEKDPKGNKKKTAEPLPPWFNAGRDVTEEMSELRQEEKKNWEQARKDHDDYYQFQERTSLRKHNVSEVIDLEAPSQEEPQEVLTVFSDHELDENLKDVPRTENQPSTSDLADSIRAEPPQPSTKDSESILPQQQTGTAKGPFMAESDDEPVEWSESEPEAEQRARAEAKAAASPARITKSPSPEFEDVPMTTEPVSAIGLAKSPSPEFEDVPMQSEGGPDSKIPAKLMSPDMLKGPENLQLPIVPPKVSVGQDLPVEIPDDESDQYSDPEDAELLASLAKEAEEHTRFVQELSNNPKANVDFNEELKQLRAQQKKDRRDADEVTQTMIAECQHLLTLFGLPYITAPMEAEAQCAELVNLGLVDGIVTDDSDTFLFGGTRVYKNMFNAAKFVECYLASDLTSEFALTREKLIDIAQLLGSDYTAGIPGIGPVTALELLSEFQSLTSFKEWWTGVQDGSISKESDKSSPFRRRFRRSQAVKLFLPTMFPDPRVAEAYLHPEVDDSPEPFQWGVPDLDALRSFLSSQIGWSKERTDEVLVPVIKDMNRREKEGTQANITRFFDGGVGAGAFAPRNRTEPKKGKGARLGAALNRLAEKERDGGRGGVDGSAQGDRDVGGGEAATSASGTDGGSKGKRRRGQGKRAAADVVTVEDGSDADGGDGEDGTYNEPSKKKVRRTRKKN